MTDKQKVDKPFCKEPEAGWFHKVGAIEAHEAVCRLLHDDSSDRSLSPALSGPCSSTHRRPNVSRLTASVALIGTWKLELKCFVAVGVDCSIVSR